LPLGGGIGFWRRLADFVESLYRVGPNPPLQAWEGM